jgi:outer membrane immunogenic protein
LTFRWAAAPSPGSKETTISGPTHSTEGGTKLYVRGGYQEINVDYNKIIQDDSVDFSGVDDSEGDYLVGVGVDVPAGGVFFRGNVDTISFDTLRATAGIGVRF